MKNILFLIIFLLITQNVFTQEINTDICHKMGKVVVIIHPNMNIDSLEQIKREVAIKGIDFKYSDCKFDDKGQMIFIKFSVKCKGCKMHGSCTLGKKRLQEFAGKSGFMINHYGKPSLSIGSDISQDI